MKNLGSYNTGDPLQSSVVGVVRSPGSQSHLKSMVAELDCDQWCVHLVGVRLCFPPFQHGLKTWKCEHSAQKFSTKPQLLLPGQGKQMSGTASGAKRAIESPWHPPFPTPEARMGPAQCLNSSCNPVQYLEKICQS